MKHRKSILIIDDHEEDRQRYVGIFTNSPEQYIVLEAADGRSGLKLWQSQPIDGVLLADELLEATLLKAIATASHARKRSP